MNKILRIIGVLVAFGILALLAGSFLGGFHPLGDGLAVVRIPVATLGLLFVFGRRRHWIYPSCVACCVLMLGFILVDRLRYSGPVGPYRLYQKNLWFLNKQLSVLAEDIRSYDVDFVTLQEVSRHNRPILQLLRSEFPHQNFCENGHATGTAVLSRYPLGPAGVKCSEWRGFSAMQVQTPDGPVWVVSQHLFWPYVGWQQPQLKRILPRYKELEGPVILGGDFNMLPGTRVEGLVAGATRTQALRPAFTTLWVGLIPLSIDQVLAECGKVERRPLMGSDHYGLVADVGFDQRTCRE